MKIEIKYPKTKKDKMIRKIKIHNRDLWSLEDNLAHIIYKCLVKFRKYQGLEGHGYPAAFNTQMGSENWSEEQEEKDVQAWIDSLDKMIYAFESIIKDRFMDDEHEKEFDKERQVIHDTYKKEKRDRLDAFNSDEMSVVYKKYQPSIEKQKERVQEGLDLFAKHFQSLWT